MEKIRITLKDGRNMDLELFSDKAPETVKNFLKYVDDGYYSGTCFHRVIPGFMIQGGGFTDDEPGIKEKGKNYSPIKGEFISNGVNNTVKHLNLFYSRYRFYYYGVVGNIVVSAPGMSFNFAYGFRHFRAFFVDGFSERRVFAV